MTPLPKNKITRAERGKRRQGNTPSLRRDVKRAKIPMHKDKLVQRLKLMMKATKRVDEKEQRMKLAEKMAKKRGKRVNAKRAGNSSQGG